VVYDSLLHKRRREIHEKIGKALEQIYSDRLEELCEMLAYHCLRGEDWQRACSYNLKAGLKALSLSAYEEAQGYFEAGLRALKKLPHTSARIEQEIDIRFNMRSALFPLGRHDDWADHVRAAEVMAKEIGDKARLANAYNYLSTHLWINGRHREAIESCEEGIRLAEAAGDFSVRISAMFHLGIPLLMMGEYERQVTLHREIAQTLSGTAAFERHGMAGVPSVLARGCLAWGLAELGEFEDAEAWGKQGTDIAEQVKNAFSSTWLYACLALAYLRSGKLDLAIELLQQTLALARNAKVQALFSFSAGSLGHAYLLTGRPDLAVPILEEAVRTENLNVLVVSSVYPVAILADAYRAVGKVQLATETLSGALKLAGEREEQGFEAWAMLVMAGINDAAERLEEAKQWYRRALQQASNLSMRPLVAHCHKGLSNCYLCLGNEKEAQLENKMALEIYRLLGMTHWLG
jgi:tetratricopeptide (TPR) repeat protein